MIRPKAAPTESRFSEIDTSGIATDRNATRSRANARMATTASTSGVRLRSTAMSS